MKSNSLYSKAFFQIGVIYACVTVCVRACMCICVHVCYMSIYVYIGCIFECVCEMYRTEELSGHPFIPVTSHNCVMWKVTPS